MHSPHPGRTLQPSTFVIESVQQQALGRKTAWGCRQARALQTEEGRDCPRPQQQVEAHSSPLHWENSGLGHWNIAPCRPAPRTLHPRACAFPPPSLSQLEASSLQRSPGLGHHLSPGHHPAHCWAPVFSPHC